MRIVQSATLYNYVLIETSNSDTWEDEHITYACKDANLGVDASDSPTVNYFCKPDAKGGKYNTPNTELNQTWPHCMKRTTTVKPRESENGDTSRFPGLNPGQFSACAFR